MLSNSALGSHEELQKECDLYAKALTILIETVKDIKKYRMTTKKAAEVIDKALDDVEKVLYNNEPQSKSQLQTQSQKPQARPVNQVESTTPLTADVRRCNLVPKQ